MPDGEMNQETIPPDGPPEQDVATGPRDIEEPEEVLEDQGDDPVQFWEKKQRDLVVSTLDYNLGALADLIQSKTIDLSPKYQRRFRWDRKRQSSLIESFLMNVPVPPIFLNEDAYGEYSVIDGKQRLTAINEFMRGRLKLKGLRVFADINGQSVDDLPESLQNAIKTRANIRAVIILRQSDPDVKHEVFQRLNTGGIRLNAQEIRNSAWPGPLNETILELSVHPDFHSLLGITKKESSVIYREMRDAEFVLRFFTFRTTWNDFSGGMMRALDRFMSENQRPSPERLNEWKADFLTTLQNVRAGFGDVAFKRWVPDQSQWRNQVIAALFDAEMFASRGRDRDLMAASGAQIQDGLRELFENEDFRKSIDAATNTPSKFRTRIRMMGEMLDVAAAP
jgi:hypothetical protein